MGWEISLIDGFFSSPSFPESYRPLSLPCLATSYQSSSVESASIKVSRHICSWHREELLTVTGDTTRSRLDRAVTARYFFFVIISNMLIFTLLGVFYNAIAQVVLQIGQHQSASVILNGLKEIPYGTCNSDLAWTGRICPALLRRQGNADELQRFRGHMFSRVLVSLLQTPFDTPANESQIG